MLLFKTRTWAHACKYVNTLTANPSESHQKLPFIKSKLLSTIAVGAIALTVAFTPSKSWACACGCGVFDVGTSSVMPTGSGGSAWLEYDYMNQDQNWHGTSKAPSADNSDKVIRTSFYNAGMQYMFNRSWGVRGVVPYWHRYFRTDDGGMTANTHSAVGDVRISAVYTGFSPDMSSGLSFGLKLPTGDYTEAGFDRDTAIGTGSTDILLGAWKMGRLTADNKWSWYLQGSFDEPVMIKNNYRPGTEFDAAAGVYHEGASFDHIKVTPLLQLVGSWRRHDSGSAADPAGTGYTRFLLSPGVEVGLSSTTTLHADVGIPVYQNMRGNQLVPDALYKVVLSYKF